MERKTLALGLVAIIAIAFGGTMTVLFFLEPAPPGTTPEGIRTTLILASWDDPSELDPQASWDSGSIDVIDQVGEGLFAYNLSDPSLAIVPRLVADSFNPATAWSPAGDALTVPLRQGVLFHDGTPFNATAVVAMWARMDWMLNTTGTNMDRVTDVEELYLLPDGTPIVKNVTINSNYDVTINLNGPYAVFIPLLCFSASMILSPTSTPAAAYIDTATGDVVGTGPFVYDGFQSGIEVSFHAFEDYHRGASPIKTLIFSIINDNNARQSALLAGDVDFLNGPDTAMYGLYSVTAGLTLTQNAQSTGIQYLGFNANYINKTLREAISYAVDYDYIIDNLMDGYAVRLKSPIPVGITYGNSSLNAPIYNVTHAREVIQSIVPAAALWNSTYVDLQNDELYNADHNNWITASFFSFNYTYNIGNPMREDMFVLLTRDLKEIGIKVEEAGTTWGTFLGKLFEWEPNYRDELELFWIGWGADYNDPSNFINPLYTNKSVAANEGQYNGYLSAIEDGRDPFKLWDNVQLLMEAAVGETDPVARKAMYDRIQYLMVERDFVYVWGYQSLPHNAYNSKIAGWDTTLYADVMGKLYIYGLYWT